MSDIIINRETDEQITFQYYEYDGVTKRTLVGATVYFTVKDNSSDTSDTDATALITKEVTSHTDAPNGLTIIALTPSQTNITPDNYFYDVKIKEADLTVHTATSGRCQINGTPTNRVG